MYIMPRKTRVNRRRMNGQGFFSDIGNFFTRTIPNAATTVYNKALKPAGRFIADKRLISQGLGAIGSILPGQAGMVANLGSKVAGQVGLGRRRKGRRGMRGGAVVRF